MLVVGSIATTPGSAQRGQVVVPLLPRAHKRLLVHVYVAMTKCSHTIVTPYLITIAHLSLCRVNGTMSCTIRLQCIQILQFDWLHVLA